VQANDSRLIILRRKSWRRICHYPLAAGMDRCHTVRRGSRRFLRFARFTGRFPYRCLCNFQRTV